MAGNTLSKKVFERALGTDEFEALMKKYEESKLQFGAGGREASLARVVTEQDKQMLKDWFAMVPLTTMAEKNGLTKLQVYSKLQTAAVRYLFQNGGLK